MKTENTAFEFKLPKNQVDEALYFLIKEGGATRLTLMAELGIMNATAVISVLRKQGVPIYTEEIHRVNKFGRDITYGKWVLLDRHKAYEIYTNNTKNY